ncbi:MAG: hypothetical protein KJ893_04890 [Candidatus Omnitrophica bacterium]|nr:hypothetical protein [Candidatus Omnitrophota bacterium]
MGISTLQGYRGAQIFEALGISDEVIERCFTGTVSRIGGAGFEVIMKETLLRHKQAYPENPTGVPYLGTGGVYQWKKDGEFHLWNPQSIAALQDATRTGDYEKYKEFARLINNQASNPVTLISFKFKGVAGQSFGAWLAKGVTFELEGLANDYVGKGISGGKIIIYPDKKCGYNAGENVLIGNTTFYGAVAGEAYIRGIAGERFCIRNSGLYAVVEGVGDHGCEYMTGGRVVVLGKAGRNFAAGMSGGIAYIYNEDKLFKQRCNLTMVELEQLNAEDKNTVYRLINNHHKYTRSRQARKILDDFEQNIKKFVKVMPLEYKRILESKEPEEKSGLNGASDI